MELLGVEILALVVLAEEDDEALVVAEGYGGGDDLQMADESVVRVVVGPESEGHHAAEAGRHLFFRDLVSLMALKTGIGDEADAGLPLQPARDGHRVFVVLAHAQRKRHRAAHDQPCVEGAYRPAQIYLRLRAYLLEVLASADYSAAHGVAVAVNVLCQALDGEVRAQLDGALVEGGGEGVVNAQQRPVPVGDLRDGGDVRDHEGGVARRFDVYEPGVRADGRLDVRGVGRVDYRGLDAEFVVEQLV